MTQYQRVLVTFLSKTTKTKTQLLLNFVSAVALYFSSPYFRWRHTLTSWRVRIDVNIITRHALPIAEVLPFVLTCAICWRHNTSVVVVGEWVVAAHLSPSLHRKRVLFPKSSIQLKTPGKQLKYVNSFCKTLKNITLIMVSMFFRSFDSFTFVLLECELFIKSNNWFDISCSLPMFIRHLLKKIIHYSLKLNLKWT